MPARHSFHQQTAFPEPLPELAIKELSLAPARWIWYPSGRTLPNTFIHFRKSFTLPSPARSALGRVSADSRYLLSVNGTRLQFGPAPCDPRHLEADPVDCTPLLREGENTLGATVLYYGTGDGTAPLGKPGFILLLEIECHDGSKHIVATGPDWRTALARSWTPGMYKRWYLRALQEVFDARRYPYGWDTPQFRPGPEWRSPLLLECPADKPPLCSTYPDYLFDVAPNPDSCTFRPRDIPLLTESPITPRRCSAAHRIVWHQPPEEYFDLDTPGAWSAEPISLADEDPSHDIIITPSPGEGIALTYQFAEEIVGFPFFTVTAPAGTIVELLVHEGHAADGPALLNTHFHAWTRFICREGTTTFTAFDYEAVAWMQLHVRNAPGPVRISKPGVLRRLAPRPHAPAIACSDPLLNRLTAASINTLDNSAQETIVDGMGRERQQYSGDGSHQLHALAYAFGDTKLHGRFVTTFSQGITLDGFFLDCWPAYDRLARVMERQLGLTPWGPILDHGIGFVFDCYYYHMYSGDLEPLREAYPRLQRFVRYLKSIQSPDTGLLPVDRIGLPSVWIDHDAYLPRHQHHKQCAFNLYAAAMLAGPFPHLASLFGDAAWRDAAHAFAGSILKGTQREFWDEKRELFVVNKPWLLNGESPRLCDRSLATAVLFNHCPGGATGPSLDALSTPPPEMGLSFPGNAGWRLWALAHGRRIAPVLHDLRTRWTRIPSVELNNTLAEFWNPRPDSGDLWSHSPVAPLYIMGMGIAGLRPLDPGWSRILFAPLPGDLTSLDVTVQTPRGPAEIHARGEEGKRHLSVKTPAATEGVLVVDQRESGLPLQNIPSPLPATAAFRIPAGTECAISLRYT